MAARIGVASGALGVAAVDLVEHLGEVSDGPLRDLIVWTDADIALLGVSASLPARDSLLPRRMTLLSAGITRSPALARTVAARTGEVWIERWSDGRATVSIMGQGTLDDDVAAVGAVAMAAAEAQQLGGRLALVTDDGPALRLVRTTVRRGDVERYELGVQAGPDDVLARIEQHAATLEIGAAQLRLLHNVHAILAHGRPVLVRATMLGAVVQPGITITYGAQSIDHALRVITGLTNRRDAAARFGTLTGSLGSTRAKAVELQLGPRDPIPALVAVDVAAD